MGGSFDRLSRLHFRWPWIVVAVLVARSVVLLTPLKAVDGVQYVYLVALTVLVAWTIWQIEMVRGICLIALVSALNLVLIAANGAPMPVAPMLASNPDTTRQLPQHTI